MNRVVYLNENNIKDIVLKTLNEMYSYDDWKTEPPPYGDSELDSILNDADISNKLEQIVSSICEENESEDLYTIQNGGSLLPYDEFCRDVLDTDEDFQYLVYEIRSRFDISEHDDSVYTILEALHDMGYHTYNEYCKKITEQEQVNKLNECVNKVINKYLK